jgi:hypothetical protein
MAARSTGGGGAVLSLAFAANTAFIDVFCQRLQAAGSTAADRRGQPERAACVVVEDWLDEVCAAVILNTTGFAQSSLKRRTCARFAAISR